MLDNKKSPIGIFDSGYGGLTVLEEMPGLIHWEDMTDLFMVSQM